MTSRSWYRIALAGATPEPVVVVAPGAHLGEAIANAVKHVGRGAWAAAVSAAAADEVPLGEAFGKHAVVDRGGSRDLALAMRWPLGVVPSFTEIARAAQIAPGFARKTRNGAVLIEALADGPALDEVLLDLVERLPAADNVEVKVLDHHDAGGSTDVWLTPRMNVKKAITFLDEHDVELLHNGHVEVSIYLRAQRSTLRLGEHKTIGWLSEDTELTDRVIGWLQNAGLAERETLTTLADVAHFHWRPAATSARRRLLDHLKREGLRQVDSYRPK